MSSIIFCNEASHKQILRKVQHIILFLHHTRWIIEAYVSDFYTHKHWQKLTKCVQEYIDSTEPPDLAWLLVQHNETATQQSTRVIPLSLLALKRCSQYFSLDRTAIDLDSDDTLKDLFDVLQNEHLSKTASLNMLASMHSDDLNFTLQTRSFQEPKYKNGQCMDMQHIFRKHVKPKKQHEIQKLGKVIHILSEILKCKSVVDVGAGLGHLSRLLTFLYNLKVTTVEAANGHGPKAAEFDRELRKDVLKKMKKKSHARAADIVPNEGLAADVPSMKKCVDNAPNAKHVEEVSDLKTSIDSRDTLHNETVSVENLPNHVVCYIEPDISATHFLEIIQRVQSEEKNSKHNVEADRDKMSFILASLHACGDLTPTLLKVFLNCPSAVALASVGCCYMKMNATSNSISNCPRLPPHTEILENYPLSSFLREQKHHFLNYECREMACHFADAYCQRLKDNSIHLKVHSYRAALQYLIKTVSPDFTSGQARLVSKKGAQGTFLQYAAEVLKKLQIDLVNVPRELQQQCEQLTASWKRVVAFYTIRLSLAPVVEALIQLDRMLFLKEMGINSALTPIFDSRLSPRNFVLLAIK